MSNMYFSIYSDFPRNAVFLIYLILLEDRLNIRIAMVYKERFAGIKLGDIGHFLGRQLKTEAV